VLKCYWGPRTQSHKDLVMHTESGVTRRDWILADGIHICIIKTHCSRLCSAAVRISIPKQTMSVSSGGNTCDQCMHICMCVRESERDRERERESVKAAVACTRFSGKETH